MAVVSEALQGIRQIKFSALEDKWEQRINDVRKDELSILARVFLADTMMISVWMWVSEMTQASAFSNLVVS